MRMASAPLDARMPAPVSFRIPLELNERMQMLADTERRTLTMQFTIAMEEHLERHGMWPPVKAKRK